MFYLVDTCGKELADCLEKVTADGELPKTQYSYKMHWKLKVQKLENFTGYYAQCVPGVKVTTDCPYIFPQRLTGDIYANKLQDELPALLENVPLQTRLQMYYQHDGAPAHFNQVVRQYLNHKIPNRSIGSGGEQNFPPLSPDMIPLV